MLVLMSTQLCSGPSPEPKDVHPFIDAAMLQVKMESTYEDLFIDIIGLNLGCVPSVFCRTVP